jgi:hypothetical protein
MKNFMRFHVQCVKEVCAVLQMLDDTFIKQKRELSLIPEDLITTLIKCVFCSCVASRLGASSQC